MPLNKIMYNIWIPYTQKRKKVQQLKKKAELVRNKKIAYTIRIEIQFQISGIRGQPTHAIRGGEPQLRWIYKNGSI